MNNFFRVLFAVVLCGGAAYASGVEVHPAVLQTPGKMNDKLKSLVTVDYSQSLVKQWVDSKMHGVQKQTRSGKKPYNASALWSSHPKTAAVSSQQSSGGNGVVDIYKKSMSPEAMEKWKNDSIAALNGGGRNPIVEAFKNSNAVNQSNAAQEAKMRELEQS